MAEVRENDAIRLKDLVEEGGIFQSIVSESVST